MLGWTPEALNAMIVTCTGCLCLLILVVLTMIGVLAEKISVEQLGTIEGVGVGGGLLGLGWIVLLVIKSGRGRVPA